MFTGFLTGVVLGHKLVMFFIRKRICFSVRIQFADFFLSSINPVGVVKSDLNNIIKWWKLDGNLNLQRSTTLLKKHWKDSLQSKKTNFL